MREDDVLVEPQGNQFLAKNRSNFINTTQGLGPLLNALGGVEKLNENLLCYLNAQDLCVLSCVSTCLWTLIEVDQALWKDLVFHSLSNDQLDSRLVRLLSLSRLSKEEEERNFWKLLGLPPRLAELHLQRKRFRFGRLFSDSLHRPLQCANCEISPNWIQKSNVIRVDYSDCSLDRFVLEFEAPRKPVVIVPSLQEKQTMFGPGIQRWQKGISIGMQSLNSINNNNNKRFRVGPRSLSGDAFAAYCALFKEENPLYIFDAEFGEKFPLLAADYQVPHYFSPSRDLFSKCSVRPDFRWIIAGAKKSGSKWHIDPNCTHAWNVSLLGRKKWIMLPPNCAPVGVFPSQDFSSVAQPLSLAEWFIEYYAQTSKQYRTEMVEFVAEVGEIVFVPSGWWHCVLNLEESFAITQNYVSSTNLKRALRLMEEKPDHISGLKPGQATAFIDEFTTKTSSLVQPEDKLQSGSSFSSTTTTGFSWNALVADKKKSGNVFAFTF